MTLGAIDNAIHVACFFDAEMAPAACVLAASLAKYAANPRRKTVLHAFSVEDTRLDFDALAATLKSDFFEIEHQEIKNTVISKLPTNYVRHVTSAAFARFMIGELLPTCSRVIYLDADALVLRSLESLYDLDLNGNLLAAAVDPLHFLAGTRFELPGSTGFYLEQHTTKDIASHSYFNNGVMLIDLSAWRKGRIRERLKFPNSLFSDQDAINELIGEDFVRLDERWNVFAIFCSDASMPAFSREAWLDVLTKWQSDPWIVHFAGECKPWKQDQGRTSFDPLFWALLREISDSQPMLQTLLADRRKSIRKKVNRKVEEAFRLPRVSIIIVNHNYGRFLNECVHSVMKQSYPAFECIVVDNGSTDETNDVLEKLKREFPGLEILRLQNNVGQCIAMQKGFARATGAFTAFIDADDYLLEDFIATHIYAHLSLPTQVGFTSSDMLQLLDDKLVHCRYHAFAVGAKSPLLYITPDRRVDTQAGDVLTNSFFSRFRDTSPAIHMVPRQNIRWLWSPTSGSLYRSDAVALFINNPNLKKLRLSGDAYLNYGINCLTGSALLDRPLAVYRIHGKNNFSRSIYLDGFSTFSKSEEKSAYAAFLALEHIVNNYDDFLGRTISKSVLNGGLSSLRRKAAVHNNLIAAADRLYTRFMKLIWTRRAATLNEKFGRQESLEELHSHQIDWAKGIEEQISTKSSVISGD